MSSAALLPPNATRAEIALSLSMARLADVPPRCREMWNPDSCPASHLPWLAWALSVDEWNHAWTDAQKRAVIKASFLVHKHKGTVGALRDALGALGYDIDMVEWFEESPPAEPYTFGLMAELDERGIAPGLWDEIEAVALSAKNARSHLRYIRLRGTTRGHIYIGGTAVVAETVTVQPYTRTNLETSGRMHIGGALRIHEVATIYPRPAEYPLLNLQGGGTLELESGPQLRLQG